MSDGHIHETLPKMPKRRRQEPPSREIVQKRRSACKNHGFASGKRYGRLPRRLSHCFQRLTAQPEG